MIGWARERHARAGRREEWRWRGRVWGGGNGREGGRRARGGRYGTLGHGTKNHSTRYCRATSQQLAKQLAMSKMDIEAHTRPRQVVMR